MLNVARHPSVVMHHVRVLLILILSVALPGRGSAQARMIYGVFGSAYGSNERYWDPPGSLGVLLGLERDQSDALALRGVGTVQHTIRMSDDVAICTIGPNDACLPRPLYPLWITTFELEAAAAIIPRVPVRLIGAGGLSLSYDAREPWSGAPRTDQDTELQAIWRAGFELRLGRSPRSARIQFTRASFGADPFALSSLKTVSLILAR